MNNNNAFYSSEDGVLFNKDKTTLIKYPEGKTDLSYAIPDSVTNIGFDAIRDCTNLTSLQIPDSVTSIESYAINDCTNLTSIDVNNNNAFYSSEDGVLFNKDKTTLIQYPIGKKNASYIIPDSVTSIVFCAFRFCSELKNITIPESVTNIGTWAFQGTPWLKEKKAGQPFVIVNGILIDFGICEGDVEIPDGVTSIVNYAFYGCSSLTSVIIPNTVTSIGNWAFEGCENITIYGYKGSIAETYANENDIPFISLGEAESIVYSLGDMTGDGAIDATDASFVLTAYAKSSTGEDDGMNDEQRKFADINGDGVVDAVDASAVLTYYARSSVDFKGTLEEFINEFVLNKK